MRSFDRKGKVTSEPGQSWGVSSDEVGVRLDVFLASAHRLGSRGRATTALERGKIFLNGEEVGPLAASTRLQLGDRVRFWVDRPGSAHVRHRVRPGGHAVRRSDALRIVYEDDVLVVVDKPAGLLTVPLGSRADAASVSGYLNAHLRGRGRRQAFAVHRLDRDTSGIVVFATERVVQQELKEQFIRREPERVYMAVVSGVPTPRRGEWRDWLSWDASALVQRPAHPAHRRAHEGRTEFEVIEAFGAGLASLLRLRLVTGKRNQIRVQAQLHGHPVIGERLYVGDAAANVDVGCDRQALHASRLAFTHPKTGRRMAFDSPLPSDIERLLAQLRGAQGRPVRSCESGRSQKV